MSASNDTKRVRPPTRQSARAGADAKRPDVKRPDRERTDAKRDDDEDEWRHEPVAPVDEPNPLKSLGRAVADVATSGGASTAKRRDR